MKKWLNRFVFLSWTTIACKVVAVPVNIPVDLRRPGHVDPIVAGFAVPDQRHLLNSVKSGNVFVVELFNHRQHPENKSWTRVIEPLLSISKEEYMASIFGANYGGRSAVLCTDAKIVDISAEGKNVVLKYATKIIGEGRWGSGVTYGVYYFDAYKVPIVHIVEIHLNDLAKISALRLPEPQEAMFAEFEIGVLRAHTRLTGAGDKQSDSVKHQLLSYKSGTDAIRAVESALCN
jgi:hypothetical protein